MKRIPGVKLFSTIFPQNKTSYEIFAKTSQVFVLLPVNWFALFGQKYARGRYWPALLPVCKQKAYANIVALWIGYVQVTENQ